MNLLKRPFRHPSRSVTPEPAPDSTKHPKLAPGSTPTSSRSINDLDIHTSALSPQPIAATNAPPLRRGSQNPVPQVKTPALVSITCPPATFPAAENKSATHDKWTGLKRFASVLRPSTNAFDFGPLKSVVDGIAESITVYEAAAEAHEEYESLRNQLDWLFHDLAGRFGESTPPAMRPSIMNLARGIEQELLALRKKQHRNVPNRYIEALNDRDRVLECYRRIHALLERLALNANVNIWMLMDDQGTSQRLDRLSPSHAAWYNSAASEDIYRDECTPDTRLEVLERFRLWQDDNESEKIYWLNGMAGTGKTMLAYTLCKQLEGDNKLVANFFCTRQLPSCRDAKLILPTIAYQLANFSYPFRYALSQILDQNRDVHTRRISEQFEKLLCEPLREVRHSLPFNLVVVIDGLDECENDRGVGEILDALFKHVSDMPIKFFLTSRPEPAIRGRMLRRRGDRDRFELHLHELDKGVVREDIKKYLQSGLKHPDFTLSNEHLEILAERSGVLFIYAATVVRYICAYDFLRSDDRLKDVLEATTGSNTSDQAISLLYNMILKRAFGDPGLNARERDEIRLVLETVICAREPLTVHTMAGILGLKGERSVDAALGFLRSVLNVQKDGTITTLHKSFPDHMLDPTRSLRFCCDSKKHNTWLARRCFDLITVAYIPPFNGCGLHLPYMLDDKLHFDQKVEQQCFGPLFYARQYWAVHLRLAERPEDILNGSRSFFLVRLLLSMEVVNLTMCMQHGVEMLSEANIPERVGRTGWSLVAEVVAVAISLREYNLALEWHEQGCSIMWSRVLQLHTPYDGLYTGNLEMAKELQRVLYGPQYAKIYGPSEWPSADNKGPLCGGDTWKRCLAERRKEILEFARLLPGLEDVLHPPKSSELVSLVQDGVAVILNIDSSRCDALVIQAGTQEIAHVPLSRFSLREAEDARVKPVPDSDIEGAEGFSEAGSECQEVPVGLWDNVVEPVLNCLGITQAPLADGPLHITWCTSGPYSSLPLHAVGHYSGHWAKIKGKERTVQSNRAISPYIPISSYTPTLSSLSQQTSPSSTFSGVLAVGPGSTRVALGAWDELSKVQIQVKHLPFTRLGGEDACTDTVLEAMETHSWVHFACCAAQTSFGPMKPGLRLHDGDLELARIARNPLKNAQLAFLSSRGTIWDCKSPDELICFAVGLLMVGYPTVIATTLPITDPSAPLIAESVYECLLESGVPDSRKAAKALHKAVAILREEVGVGQFARWARYVHIGR